MTSNVDRRNPAVPVVLRMSSFLNGSQREQEIRSTLNFIFRSDKLAIRYRKTSRVDAKGQQSE